MRHLIFVLVFLAGAGVLSRGYGQEGKSVPEGGYVFQDNNGDGINDNLLVEPGELTGQQESAVTEGAPLADNGGRQEARMRFRHGYHGKELERDKNLHQHKK